MSSEGYDSVVDLPAHMCLTEMPHFVLGYGKPTCLVDSRRLDLKLNGESLLRK